MVEAIIGIIGLGVMGHMLGRNMERHGYCVAGYDLDPGKVRDFGANGPGKNLLAYQTLPEFLDALERPRRILIMVPAGKAVDGVISSLQGHLAPGDLLIDGGNSFFLDTERRSRDLKEQGVFHIGMGVSGGEQGALWGPAIMVGGEPQAWELVRPIFEAISAHVGDEPCAAYVGLGGAGHYVKMVHNGIEYGDMQLIAEAYDLLHRGLGLDNGQLQAIFNEWNRGELESYLIEITADIFSKVDGETGIALLDLILDEAQQKGTGKWASQNALDLGAPIPTINAAVESRILSAYKDERISASRILIGPEPKINENPEIVIKLVRDALYVAKLCSYAQGFALMRLADREYAYEMRFSDIARIWRGGCIIRARFLDDIRRAYERQPDLVNLMLDPGFAKVMNTQQYALRRVVSLASGSGIPTLGFSSALGYFDAYRSERLPANLLQAQRDYFGAHTYQRVDKPRSEYFHTEWEKGQGS